MAGFGFPWTATDTSMGTEMECFRWRNDEEIYASRLWRGLQYVQHDAIKDIAQGQVRHQSDVFRPIDRQDKHQTV